MYRDFEKMDARIAKQAKRGDRYQRENGEVVEILSVKRAPNGAVLITSRKEGGRK